MRTNRIILLVGVILLSHPLMAQREIYNSRSVARNAGDTNIVKSVGWVRYHFLDEWNISAQAGGQLYYGYEDRLGPLTDRVTGQSEVYVGRWVFPMIGFRFGAGMGSASGFLSKDTYNAYQTSIAAEDHNGIGGQCDPGLCGYYRNYSSDLYRQQWDYHYFTGDLIVDLGIFRDYELYNPEAKWNNIIYAGVATRFAHTELEGYKNHKSEFHFGYIGKYNINPHWSLYADLRGSFMERTFDREWVGGLESPQGLGDFVLNCQVGLNYHFHFRDEETRRRFYALDPDGKSLSQASSEGPRYVHYVQVEEFEEVRIMDSIFHYANDSTPTLETQRIIDSLSNELDNRINSGKRGAWEQPLDSIFLNHLLPYEMVFFELDKWNILASEEMKIAKMAYIMKNYPNEKFILTGSADSKTGTVKRNIFLSHNRADVVYNKLVMEYDVNPDQLVREYLGGILDYEPFMLNRTTVIIMDHPAVRKAFEEMKSQHKAGGGEVQID